MPTLQDLAKGYAPQSNQGISLADLQAAQVAPNQGVPIANAEDWRANLRIMEQLGLTGNPEYAAIRNAIMNGAPLPRSRPR